MTDAYRTVTALVTSVRPNSIFVEKPRGVGNISIPRSLIHAADDMKMDAVICGSSGVEHTFRLRGWKAEEIGLA